jgi:ubiquinone/menaquinone biosynthesis C-methylase UbiE
MDQKEFEKWNEKMFIKYNNERLYLHPNLIVRWTESLRVKTILRLISVKFDDKILSIGCGEGYIENQINSGCLYMLDISTAAVERAKNKLERKNNIKEIIVGDALNIPYQDNTFDFVLCSEVIEHTLNPQQLIKEIERVAKKGAKIIITIPNEKHINRIKKLLIKIKLFNIFFKDIPIIQDWHLHNFDLNLLKQLTKKYLFIKKIVPIPNFLMPLRYVCLLEKK